ncbi:MAG: IclR family transcriptional regulator [Candidatus Aminicenantes bacterium]|nr:MAG: IclR family transcriptional regulator [Candidatus Aminicenantes bacterium]
MNQSVKKAFEVLSFVVDNPQKMSLNQRARVLKMNKTTLFRFLSTLESLKLLDKRDDYYVPGIKLFELGSKVPVKQLIVDRVHPFLSGLTAEVNETVNMGEMSNGQVLYLDKTESQRSLQIQTYIGSYTDLHCTALGKAILSILPESGRDRIISGLNFDGKTPNTITDPGKLQVQIKEVVEKGYSIDREELEEGLHCVAVPLCLAGLNFFGAISCSGPSVRFTSQRMAELAVKLKETVEEIKQVFR